MKFLIKPNTQRLLGILLLFFISQQADAQRFARPCYVPGVNGCGTAGILMPEELDLYRFEESCNWHDRCWGTCNLTKEYCDDTFYDLLRQNCDDILGHTNNIHKNCLQHAYLFWNLVSTPGISPKAYEWAQDEACAQCYEVVYITGGGLVTICEDAETVEEQTVRLYGNGLYLCNASEYNPRWITPDGRVVNGNSVRALVDGNYTLIVTDKDGNNCSGSTSIAYKEEPCDEEPRPDPEPDPDPYPEPIPDPKANDPNDISGPAGYGAERWVSVRERMSYLVRFENDSNLASAPARNVHIRVPLSSNIDQNSFKLGSFGFGNFSFRPPEGSAFYTDRLDLIDSLGVLLNVTAGIDVQNREAFWLFESVDPRTGLLSTNPLLGFLPVNNAQNFGKGQGFVKYSILPDASASTGDSISAQASIIFDENDAIPTNFWHNTIDAVAPVSSLSAMANLQDSSYSLRLTGQDDPGGSGMRFYSLYLSTNNAPFVLLEEGIPADSAYSLKTQPGDRYCLFARASDFAGNPEAFKTMADTCLDGLGNPQLTLLSPNGGESFCQNDSIRIRWQGLGVQSVDIYLSDNGGSQYTIIAQNQNGISLSWPIPGGQAPGSSFRIAIQDSNDPGLADSSEANFSIVAPPAQPQIMSPQGTMLCRGDSLALEGPAGFVMYRWSNGANGQVIQVNDQGKFSLQVVSPEGCISPVSDSVEVEAFDRPAKPDILRIGSDSLAATVSAASYRWSLDGQPLADNSQRIAIQGNGRYRVVAINGPCESDPADEVVINTATEPLLNQISLNIFPQPASDYFMIEAAFPRDVRLQASLYDPQGKLLFDKALRSSGGKVSERVITSKYPAGVYILKLAFGEEMRYVKVQVAR